MKSSSLLANKYFLIIVLASSATISVMNFLAYGGLLPDWYWEFGSPYIENSVKVGRDFVRWIGGV